MAHFDVLSVGDITVDAFVKLLDDQAAVYKNDYGEWLAMPFGSKLAFDYSQIVEAAGNVGNSAVSFARLGLNSGLVSNVGGDQFGRDMISSLQQSGVDIRFVRINPHMPSNYHYILWYKEERTILTKHVEYDYLWPQFKPEEVPEWIYFSSISKNALGMHDDIATWLEANPDVKLAFQPGTMQIHVGAERLSRIYARTYVLLLNREEAAEVTKSSVDDIHVLFDKLHALGPKIVVISDGPDGAYASDGQERFKMPAYPDPSPPLERTGAGDAFSSAFVAAIIKGNNVEGALQWSPINSMSVVQHVGSREGLLTEDQMEDFLRQAPEWYRPEKI